MPYKAGKFCNVGNFFRQARLSQGLTQDSLSEIAEVSPRHLTNLERGMINPSFETMRRLLKVLQVDPRPLFYPEVLVEKDLEQELLCLFRRCSETDQQMLLRFSQCLANGFPSER